MTITIGIGGQNRSIGGGGRLVSRVLMASGDVAAPTGAGWCVARALGAGGQSYWNNVGDSSSGAHYLGGGGGGYSRAGFAVAAGDKVTCTPAAANVSTSAPGSSKVTYAGNVVCSAQSGFAAADGQNAANAAKGGQAGAGVGDVTRSGGSGAVAIGGAIVIQATSGAGGPGVNPYTATDAAPIYQPGGSSAGDFGDADTLGFGSYGLQGDESSGAGGSGQNSLFYAKRPGAGGCTYPSYGQNGIPPSPGQIILEFYDVKPS